MKPFSRNSRNLRYGLIGVLALATFSLSACGGSALEAADVLAANAAVEGRGGGSAGTGTDTGTGDGSVDPDVTPVAGDTGGEPVDDGTSGGGGGDTPVGGGETPVGGGGTTNSPATGNGGKKADCTGFKNSVGITDSTITIANISDVTGPVPGVFTPAQQAVKAYVSYFNKTSDICGRKLAIKSYDSQTNTSADAVATQKACDETFASVGSMEAFDSGGASTATKCGIPELHAITTTKERVACPNCFATESGGNNMFQTAVPDFFTGRNKAATQKAAMLYVGVSASVDGAKLQIAGEKKRGWKFVYESSFDIAEFNYGPYVQRLKETGARIVQLFGSADMAVRFARAFKAANYKPDFFIMNATSYDKNFEAAGADVNGSIIYVDFTPLAEASSNPELRTYLQWLQQVAPGARPTYFGMYAWSAARLFVERAAALGGDLNRANLIKSIKGVHTWTANGLHAPQDVGGKKPSKCWRFLQIQGGQWKPYGPARYTCGGLVKAF